MYSGTSPILIFPEEIELFLKNTGLPDMITAHELYAHAVAMPLVKDFGNYDFGVAIGCIFAAGRVQGIREERAKKKAKVERLQAAAAQQ